jgi:hypothetical protein
VGMNNEHRFESRLPPMKYLGLTDVPENPHLASPLSADAPSAAELSGWRQSQRLSPLIQLMAERARRRQRIIIPGLAQPVVWKGPRETLARLRAVEQAVWQASGGDFLRRMPPE